MRYKNLNDIIIRRISLLSILFVLLFSKTMAQLPSCGNTIYMIWNHQIYNYDPALPFSASNPTLNSIALPSQVNPTDALGLAVGPNLNGSGPSPTFYTNRGGRYYYYDGTNWVNTGHAFTTVPGGTFNFGSGGNFIYSYEVSNGNVFKYDGTGNATLVVTLGSQNVSPNDIIADCLGNFYILNTKPPQFYRKYSPAGVVLNSWAVNGIAANTFGGGGLAAINDTVYFNNADTLYKGVINGSNINFTQIILGPPASAAFIPNDFANCAAGATSGGMKASIDTGYYCGGAGLSVSATGIGTFTWSVLSGPAVIIGTGSPVSIVSPASSKILLTGNTVLCTGSNTDTVTIISPQVILDAGLSDTAFGCGGLYADTLHATFTNAEPWLKYNITWSPSASVITTSDPLKPIVHPPGVSTFYTIQVETGADQGNCKWADSVKIEAVDGMDDTADFSFNIRYGCKEDTIIFTNKSSASTLYALWDFGDATTDTAYSPTHLYKQQGNFNVLLTSSNKHCRDTISKTVSLSHPLAAAIKTVKDSFCHGDTLFFDGTGSAAGAPKFFWDFGDGNNATGVYANHVYDKDQGYMVRLVVQDFRPCTDTAYRLVYPDIISLPSTDLGNDTTLCNGDVIYLPFGLTTKADSFLWNDGSTASKYKVDAAGIYKVRVTNNCGEAYDSIKIDYHNCMVWFPSAFTPNADGRNDLAHLLGNIDNISSCTISIYDRRGTRVFHTEDKYQGWDGRYKGTLQSIGPYYYMVRYTINGKAEILKGDITLLL